MRSRCCLCVCVCVCMCIPLSLLGSGSVNSPYRCSAKHDKNTLSQRLGRNVTAVTNTHTTIEELLDVSFSMWPMSYEGK
jgi:hypothetical protein